MPTKRIAIIGSTGSIGTQALEVISEHPGLEVCALGGGSNVELLARQTATHRPPLVAVADPDSADALKADLPGGTQLLAGDGAMTELVARSKPDVLLSAVVGAAGLEPTLEGIRQGATLAIANKETLVMAGAIVMPAARAAGVPILPVDSEHSAIFQCLCSGHSREVNKVTITASGGALRDWETSAVASATVDDALNHPTWQMGRKITIDSATLINKALEVIEAHWLFDLPAEKIDVLIHPESIVHSLVEFCDGNVIAQLARPDMKLPIAFALCYPDRPDRHTRPLDLPSLGQLTFRKPTGRFARGVELGFEVIRRGGVSGAVLNGANEEAVAAFLERKISFGKIVSLVEEIVNRCDDGGEVTVSSLRSVDAWARREVREAIHQMDPTGSTRH
ncbi:MAG: 1-deoxy-D-xylulose-5-phosphate reductoisomerase [Phycisphaerae bacterium]